jgi:preprotein translocase subunit YajC
MFISTAYAQTAGAGDGPLGGLGMMGQFLPIVAIFVIFYFLLLRPQQRKAKEHKALLASVRRGDRVVTGGGILGLVTKVVDENYVQVEIADGVRVKVLKSTLADIPSRTAPAQATAGSKRDDEPEEDEEEADEEAESEAEEPRKTTRS